MTKMNKPVVLYAILGVLTILVVLFATGAIGSFTGNSLKLAAVGDRITFGKYRGEAVVWRILTVEGKKMLAISESVLDLQPYNIDEVDVTWERCTLRDWLNRDFLYAAFSESDREHISETRLVNSDNKKYSVYGGRDTQDSVFLLSIDEVERYYKDDEDRAATISASGVERSEERSRGLQIGEPWYWWLRSPGASSVKAAFIQGSGMINYSGAGPEVDDVYGGIRPAIWLNP